MPHFMNSSEDVGPDDLDQIYELFETVCSSQHIEHRSAAADQLAKRIIQLYRAGVRDRSVYLELVSVQRHRRADDTYLRGSKPH